MKLQRFVLFAGLVAIAFAPATAFARKAEDVFKGKVVIVKKRLKSRFKSQAEFIAALKANRIDKVWPKEQKGNDSALWKLEYWAFFPRPLGDYEVGVKFYDITGGQRKYVAGDAQMTRDKDSRVMAADIKLEKPPFEVNHKYLMVVDSRGRPLAKTTFWLRGEAEQFTGTVEFADEEVGGKRKSRPDSDSKGPSKDKDKNKNAD